MMFTSLAKAEPGFNGNYVGNGLTYAGDDQLVNTTFGRYQLSDNMSLRGQLHITGDSGDVPVAAQASITYDTVIAPNGNAFFGAGFRSSLAEANNSLGVFPKGIDPALVTGMEVNPGGDLVVLGQLTYVPTESDVYTTLGLGFTF